MPSPDKTKTGAGSRGAAAARPLPADRSGAGSSYWIRVQGNSGQVLQADERPSTEHGEGENLVRVSGPYNTAAIAQECLSRMRFA